MIKQLNQFSENTLFKVYDALKAVGIEGQAATDVINQMGNRGILFRERIEDNELVPVTKTPDGVEVGFLAIHDGRGLIVGDTVSFSAVAQTPLGFKSTQIDMNRANIEDLLMIVEGVARKLRP